MILITEDVWGPEFEALSNRYQLRYEPDLWKDPSHIKEILPEVTAWVVRNKTKVTSDLISSAPNLRVIARAGVGLDNIDLTAANAAGVAVSAALGVNAVSVAEHTLGLALSLARDTIPLNQASLAGQWNRLPGVELAGKTWGLLGFGATARATAHLLKGFGLRIQAYDPYATPTEAQLNELNASLGSAEEVFSNSDLISIHLPNTPSTNKFVNAQSIAQMKDGVYIINVGRGEVIDETDLIQALKSGKVAGAGLDVRESEPPVVGEMETLKNVVLTPHIAGITNESQSRIIRFLSDDIDRALSNKDLICAVGDVKTFATTA